MAYEHQALAQLDEIVASLNVEQRECAIEYLRKKWVRPPLPLGVNITINGVGSADELKRMMPQIMADALSEARLQ